MPVTLSIITRSIVPIGVPSEPPWNCRRETSPRTCAHSPAWKTATFVIANVPIVLPSTWRYFASYVSGGMLVHHGYLYDGALYVTNVPISPLGVPVTFYMRLLATKVPPLENAGVTDRRRRGSSDSTAGIRGGAGNVAGSTVVGAGGGATGATTGPGGSGPPSTRSRAARRRPYAATAS